MRTLKYLSITGIICGIFLCFTANSFAGNADVYKVTVQSILLKNSSDEWVTIATPNEEIDIAGVGAGASAASFLNDASIPMGSYKNFKIRLSETMKVSGSDGAHYTNSGGTLTILGTAGTAASTATWPADPPTSVASLTENIETHTASSANQGEITYTLDLDAGDSDNYIEVFATNDSDTPVTVNRDSAISIWFDFDTQGTVHYVNDGGNDKMFYTPPQSGTAFSITVDGTTLTITEAAMQLDF